MAVVGNWETVGTAEVDGRRTLGIEEGAGIVGLVGLDGTQVAEIDDLVLNEKEKERKKEKKIVFSKATYRERKEEKRGGV